MDYLEGISHVEMQFVNILGRVKAIEISPQRYKKAIERGKVFDGSSVDLSPIENSDLTLIPITETFFRLPWNKRAARVLCDIYTADGKLREYELSPRYILKKQVEKCEKRGFKPYMAVENEFFILKEGSNGLEPIDKAGYCDVTPKDKTKKYRQELFEALPSIKIEPIVEPEYTHHEVAPGEGEITLKYDKALEMADKIITFRYFSQNYLDYFHGLTLTLMPKFREGINGNGLHHHVSLFNIKNNENTFYDEKDTLYLSDTARFFIGGILDKFKPLTGIATPSINSRKRLVPGYEAPINRAWGPKNRSALIRIPSFQTQKEARIEFRMPDSTSNPYLLEAYLIAAGLRGIEKKIDPEEFYTEENTYKLENQEKFETVPRTPEEVIEELKKDELAKEIFGKIKEKYVNLLEKEWKEYKEIHKVWNPEKVTKWEIEKYLIL